MTIIDSNTVAVETFSELRSVLQNTNTYTLVYLAANITMTGGIAILPSKSQVIIDGFYPLDGSGTTHTLTEYASADSGNTLGIRSASSISMTVRNMNIVGQNYYGILYVPEGSAYETVTVTYENITYVGPQITYHPNGITRYIDCNITISPAYSAANEVGEVYRVEIGGTTTIQHNDTSNSIFWFRGSNRAPSFTVLPGAHVTITTRNYGFYTANPIALTVGEGASVTFHLSGGLCYNASHELASVLIDTGASLRIFRTAGTSSATIYCRGAFTMNEHSDLYMESNYANNTYHIYFSTSSASLTLNNPKSFVLYANGSTNLYTATNFPVTIRNQQLNIWSAAKALESAGGITDLPMASWRKSDGSLMELSLTVANNGTTVVSHNFTTEELATLPTFSYLHLQIARVLSIGTLPLALDPITNDAHPITGTTEEAATVQAAYTVSSTVYADTTTSESNGAFSLDTSVAIPTNTQVTVTANIPFLITRVTLSAVEAGALTLISAPEYLEFLMVPIAQNPVMLGRLENTWSMKVSDTRTRSGPWYLYASIDGPMTGEIPSRTLPDCLIFVDEDDIITSLGTDPVLVYTGRENGGIDLETDVTWPAARGILLLDNGAPFYNGERYTAPIHWTLTDTPPT